MTNFGVPPPFKGFQAQFEAPTLGFTTNFGVPLPLEDLPDEFEAPTLGFMAEFWGATTF